MNDTVNPVQLTYASNDRQIDQNLVDVLENCVST